MMSSNFVASSPLPPDPVPFLCEVFLLTWALSCPPPSLSPSPVRAGALGGPNWLDPEGEGELIQPT